jgi:hypothetical protein
MKTKILITIVVLALSLVSANVNSQGLYVKIDAGYGLKFSSQSINYFNFTNFIIDTVSSNKEQVNTSLGKGFNFEGAIGYMFNKYVGAELAGSYLLGAKTKTKQELYGGVRNNSLSANMIRINPSIIIAGGFEKINPYAKFGLIIGFGKITYQDDYTTEGGSVISEKTILNGGVAFGLNAGVGVNFKVNKLISLFGEVNMVNLSYSPLKGELTKSTINGNDRLPDMSIAEKNVDFVSEYTSYTHTPYVHTEPRQELIEKFPFGNVGLNLGIKFTF